MRQYRLQVEFIKEERAGFQTKAKLDKVVSSDELSDVMAKFTEGYTHNPNWHSLTAWAEDLQKAIKQ